MSEATFLGHVNRCCSALTVARTPSPIISPPTPSNSVSLPRSTVLREIVPDAVQHFQPTHRPSVSRSSCLHCPRRTLSPCLSEPWPGGEHPLNDQQQNLEVADQSSADNFADQWVDQKISISDYSLSASVACGKFCCAMVGPCETSKQCSRWYADRCLGGDVGHCLSFSLYVFTCMQPA